MQLVQSAKMASIGLLAGGIAHEINNPLTGVLNNVQLIRMVFNDKQKFNMNDFNDLMDSIEESAQRCARITNSLLNFSRASKGVFQNISLNDIVEKVLLLIEHELSLENIVFHKKLRQHLPPVKGDVQLLQQIIFDIINNARWAIQKKSGKQGGSVTIETDTDEGNNSLFLSIADTGIGIPKENLEKIYEPFFTTKSAGEGTGLGLSIVYNIIKEHGGKITVESGMDEGTVFKIVLPAVAAQK